VGGAPITWDYQDTLLVDLGLGTGASTVNVLGTGVNTTIFNRAAATINVGSSGATVLGSVADIQGQLNLENESGALDTVNINSQNDAGGQNVLLDTATRPGGETSLGFVQGLVGGALITYDYADTSAVNLNLGTGVSIVTVLSTGVTTNIVNSADATIDVGNGGSVAGIQGALHLENPPAFDTILINSQNDSAAQNVTLSTIVVPGNDALGAVDGLVGGAEITWEYRDTHTVDLNLGTGASVVTVLGTEAPTTTNIFNSANATIFVGGDTTGSAAGIQGALNLENERAFDTITINSQNDFATQTVTLNTITQPGDSSLLGSIDGLVGGGQITYDYSDTLAVTLNLGVGATTVNVLGTGVNTNIFNSSNATINVGSNGFNVGSLAGIQGALLLENEPDFDTIVIDDSANTVGQFYNMTTIPGDEASNTFEQVTSGVFGRNGSITFDNADTSQVQLLGGDGGNQFDIFSTVVPTQIDGGAGANTFNVLPQGTSASLGASILGPLNLGGGGGANNTLNVSDQFDPNSEVFNFAIDQFNFGDLTLASNSTFDMSFNGFNSVNLFTNGHSTVNDPNDPNGILHVH
jgi:hypothetical protein